MIKPTPGRVVHYWEKGMKNPLPAMVVEVLNDRSVHLMVLSMHGALPRAGVQLLQDADKPTGVHWAEWMDYQKGQAQAADTNPLQKRLEEAEALIKKHAGMLAQLTSPQTPETKQ